MKRFHYFEISSTNDYAKEHLKSFNSVIVTADFQSFGRGRNYKTWEGNPGENVYFSYGTNHPKPLNYKHAALYQAIGSLAVINILRTIAPGQVFTLKYPNDIYAKHDGKFKKISGVLVEQSFTGEKCTSSVIGIGINVNQTDFLPEIEDNAVSLKMLGINYYIDDIYNLLASKIFYYEQLPPEQIREEWIENLNIINKEIEVKGKPGEWIAKEILDDCRLLIYEKTTDQSLVIDNGDTIRYDLG